MSRQTFFKYLTRVHKWAGLIIGLQLLLWMLSGLFMSWFYIEDVRGEWLAEQIAIPAMSRAIIDIEQAAALYEGELESVLKENYAGYTVYEMSGSAGTLRVDGRRGALWKPLMKSDIKRAAQTYYFGAGELTTLTRLDKSQGEFSYYQPVWQARFEGKDAARLYIDTDTGELLSVRTDLWRVYDFMWGLHIMDWQDREATNSWWLKLAAAAGSLFVLTGFGLLMHRFLLRPKRGS